MEREQDVDDGSGDISFTLTYRKEKDEQREECHDAIRKVASKVGVDVLELRTGTYRASRDYDDPSLTTISTACDSWTDAKQGAADRAE